MSENIENNSRSLEKKAISVSLYIILIINSALLLYGIFSAGKLIAYYDNVNLIDAMWGSAQGGTIVHAIGIAVCLAIGILHWVNTIIGKKAEILERVISILLKLPVNIIFLLIACYFAFLGYSKYSVVGGSEDNLLGGNYIIDWITACTLLYLVFGIKKV
tara:strand:+ start:76 stop:555 length:480 start_codon:yes stop_codon:yes gene_type:complete